MKDIEIGYDSKRNEIIIAMDGIEPTCWISVTEDEALTVAMALVDNVLQLRKQRRLSHE